MILIGENIHIISKSVKQAFENRDLEFIKNLLDVQKDMDCIELNIGPSKKESVYEWLVPFVKQNSDLPLSFDTSNYEEIKLGLELFGDTNNCIINSASLDKFDNIADLALKHNTNLVLLITKGGIPKTADGRLEIVYELYQKCFDKGLNFEKLYFDPLVLPLCVDQSQAVEVVNTIRMIKEIFENQVKTIVGLSNISNGSPSEVRPLLNRVFACFLYGAGLDSAIIDAKDNELCRILKMLEKGAPEKNEDNLYLKISEAVQNFGEITDIDYNVDNEIESKIMKAALVISGKKIYSHSFTQI